MASLKWYDYPKVQPVTIYELGQRDRRELYLVMLPRKQVTTLQWHSVQGGAKRWEWLNGKKFNGDVLRWAEIPDEE